MGDATAGATGRLHALAGRPALRRTVTLRIVGIEQIPALAERSGPARGTGCQNIVGMAGAMHPRGADNPSARDVPVTIRDGVARIGLIPLGTIPAPQAVPLLPVSPCRAAGRSRAPRSPGRRR